MKPVSDGNGVTNYAVMHVILDNHKSSGRLTRMSNRADQNDIVCIGTVRGIDVNFYISAVVKKPTIELIGATGRITFTPGDVYAITDLIIEAEQFWLEEGRTWK